MKFGLFYELSMPHSVTLARLRDGERTPPFLAQIAASFTSCDTDLPQIRFVMDAGLPVTQGTRRIG